MFFARPTVAVARELIGCRLVVDPGGASTVVASIVECEAYLGSGDPASHAFRGPTPRASIMFGEPGHLYVYLSRGIHHCANLVTERDGTAGAVLLRAAGVEEGEAIVRGRRRDGLAHAGLLRGPGNLTRGLGLTLLDNGADVCGAGARLLIAAGSTSPPVVAAPRVGISAAIDDALRFAWSGHPAVSAPVPWPKRKGPD
jgi:DNA-3-methyladenine glycosylase